MPSNDWLLWLLVVLGLRKRSETMTPPSQEKPKPTPQPVEEKPGLEQRPQPAPSPAPSTKPKPVEEKPETPPTSMSCLYMNTTNPCVSAIGYPYASFNKQTGEISFRVNVPRGCECCFDVSAFVEEPSGKYYYQQIKMIGPYKEGAHNIVFKAPIPEYTKIIRVFPRCKGAPYKPAPPKPSEKCSLTIHEVKAWFDKEWNAVKVYAKATLKSNCFNCSCHLSAYATSKKLWPGASTRILECFTTYGHSETCADWGTPYATSGHGSDVILVEFYVNNKKVAEREVSVSW